MIDEPEKRDEDVEEPAAEAPEGEAAAEAPEAEEKPKRRRTRRKKAAEEAPAAEADAAEDEEEPAAEEPAAEEPADDDGDEDDEAAEETAPAPARARRRDRAGEPDRDVAVRAKARYVRTSARKARLVADHVRGKDVEQARALLALSPRAVARDWSKVLESAVANAEHNHELVGEDLRIVEVFADEGPTLKRYRPRAMGRATRIRKRTSHLTITLRPKE